MRAFACARYLEWLCAETARANAGARCVAHLLALGVLDARFDTLLLPVLVSRELPDSSDPLLNDLNACNAEFGWNLPSEFFLQRLSAGACLILLDGPDERAERSARLYPKCRLVTDPDTLLQSSSTCL